MTTTAADEETETPRERWRRRCIEDLHELYVEAARDVRELKVEIAPEHQADVAQFRAGVVAGILRVARHLFGVLGEEAVKTGNPELPSVLPAPAKESRDA